MQIGGKYPSKLNPRIIRELQEIDPPWGPCGYIVYKRTYARMIEAYGRTEDWDETIERAINGLLEIGARYTHEQAAQLAYYWYMLKGTMAGRPTWQLGTEPVRRIGGDSLMNCVAGETEVITNKGVFPVRDLIGKSVKVQVLTEQGLDWIETTFKSYGIQPLMAVELADGTVVRTTPDHQWIRYDNGKPYLDTFSRMATQDLLKGRKRFMAPLVFPEFPEQDAEYREGYAHGFVFGDGEMAGKGKTKVVVFPAKLDMLGLLLEYGDRGNDHPWDNGSQFAPIVMNLPASWKELPENHSRSYAFGFVLGLGSADGSVSNLFRIFNKDRDVMLEIQRLARYAGFRCHNPYLDREISPFDGSEKPLWCCTISTFNLTENLFIRDDQAANLRQSRIPKSIQVTQVKDLGIQEEVFCCTVPIWHNFTLANGAVTGQCWFVACNEPIDPFTFAFNELMLGGGVGFSITPENVYALPIVRHNPLIARVDNYDCEYIVTDNREGWVELLRRVLYAFFFDGKPLHYNTLAIRAKGRPIKGFGGVASGPEELVKGIGQICQILRNAHLRKLRPTECLHIMNIIGQIVVAGNCRRCIPGSTFVHTKRGLIRIEKIQIGDEVQTLKGYKRVTNVFNQGVQKLFTVVLSNGKEFRCTPNHKVAVLQDMDGEIEWRTVEELDGGETLLLNGRPCGEISSMLCDPSETYFFGQLTGDGNVYLRPATSPSGSGGTVTIALTRDEDGFKIAEKIHSYLNSIGLTGAEAFDGGNGMRINIYSTDFAWELIRYKTPHQCPRIPEKIYQSDWRGRAAFLAGLCDADGTPDKYNLCSSKYTELLVEVQKIASSLGIDTYIATRPDRISDQTGEVYDNENMLIIRGFVSRQHAFELLNPFMVKQFPLKTEAKFDASIPVAFATDMLERQRITKSEFNKMTLEAKRGDGPRDPIHKQLCEFSSFWRDVIPIQVREVLDFDAEDETYDIEVEGEHCFFAEGLLVHNSAEIAIGAYDDIEFLQAKNWYLKPIPAWAQMSNNTVQTPDISLMPDCFWDGYEGRGEPYGLLNLDLCKRYGRLVDAPRPDPFIGGANPCVTGRMWIQTAKGPKKVSDLLGGQFDAIVDGHRYQSTDLGFFSSGVKSVYRVETGHGYSFECTDNHEIYTPNGKTALSELSIGDEIDLHNHRPATWKGEGSNNQGWLVGNLLGDGVRLADSGARLSFWGSTKGSMHEYATGLLQSEFEVRSDCGSGGVALKYDRMNIGSVALREYANKYLNVETKELSEGVEKTSYHFHCGLLRGWFDADGSPQGNQKKGVSVRLSSVVLSNLYTAQRMLARLGIISKVYTNRTEAGPQAMPGGVYECQAGNELIISKENLFTFAKKIGFTDLEKALKLESLLDGYTRSPYREKFTTQITSIEYIGQEEVFDCQIRGAHNFDCNGVKVSNCSEILLESHESCNLSEIYLPNIIDVNEFASVAELLFIGNKAISCLPCWHPKTNEVQARNHRIGVGITGFLQATHLNDDSDIFDAVYEHLEEVDERLSRDMGVSKSIRKTTVKPSGTLSLLAGVTPGVHASYSPYYIRRVTLAASDPLVETCRSHGYNVEPKINIDGSRDYNTLIADFPIATPRGVQCADNYSAIRQLENQRFLQTYWADNSVSMTCYFQSHELEDIKAWLGENYPHSVKTASFLLHSEHGFVQAPYEQITEAQYYELVMGTIPITSIIDTSIHELVDSQECDSGGCPVK